VLASGKADWCISASADRGVDVVDFAHVTGTRVRDTSSPTSHDGIRGRLRAIGRNSTAIVSSMVPGAGTRRNRRRQAHETDDSDNFPKGSDTDSEDADVYAADDEDVIERSDGAASPTFSHDRGGRVVLSAERKVWISLLFNQC
jgi:hypothetical protein